jgi:hypothetical protein
MIISLSLSLSLSTATRYFKNKWRVVALALELGVIIIPHEAKSLDVIIGKYIVAWDMQLDNSYNVADNYERLVPRSGNM